MTLFRWSLFDGFPRMDPQVALGARGGGGHGDPITDPPRGAGQ